MAINAIYPGKNFSVPAGVDYANVTPGEAVQIKNLNGIAESAPVNGFFLMQLAGVHTLKITASDSTGPVDVTPGMLVYFFKMGTSPPVLTVGAAGNLFGVALGYIPAGEEKEISVFIPPSLPG